MKTITITIIFAILSIADANADVLYCYEEKRIGFKTSDGMRAANLIEQKFTIKVDFENNKLDSKTLSFNKGLEDHSKCWGSSFKGTEKLLPAEQIMCASEFGTSF